MDKIKYKNNTSLINYAKTLIGIPYKWGGTTTSGLDCSGFVYYVFQKSQGITLPRTTTLQYTNIGLKVTSPSAGDLTLSSLTPHREELVYHTSVFISETSNSSTPPLHKALRLPI